MIYGLAQDTVLSDKGTFKVHPTACLGNDTWTWPNFKTSMSVILGHACIVTDVCDDVKFFVWTLYIIYRVWDMNMIQFLLFFFFFFFFFFFCFFLFVYCFNWSQWPMVLHNNCLVSVTRQAWYEPYKEMKMSNILILTAHQMWPNFLKVCRRDLWTYT